MKTDSTITLITGSTGFIGGHLVKRLMKESHQLRCTYRSENPPNEPAGVEWVKIDDFSDLSEWRKNLKDVQFVIHLAALAHRIGDKALNIEAYRHANTFPTGQIAKAAKEEAVERIIFISSISAIGSPNTGDTLTDSTPPSPETPYGISKLEAELQLERILSDSPETDWVTLRPSLVYGPSNPGNMDRIARLVGLRIPLPFRSIRNRRSFLYIENLTSAILASLRERSLSRKTFLISDDETVSTLGLARLIASAQGNRLRSFPLPTSLLAAAAKSGDLIKTMTGRSIGIDSYSLGKLISSLCVDNTRFKKEANWSPPYTLQEGINRTFSTKPE